MSAYGEAVVINVRLLCESTIETAPRAEQLKREAPALAAGIEKAVQAFLDSEMLELDWRCKIVKSGPAID